jgi:DNA-3-methyladenine glycosylase II
VTHRLLHIPQLDHHKSFLARASEHLISFDPRFKILLEKHHCHLYSPEGLAEGVDPYNSLVTGIISQQVSGAAAKSIRRKFILLFTTPDEEGNPPSGYFPTPHDALTKTIPELRTAGLSARKAEYVLDVSARFADGRLNTQDMIHDTDEEIKEKLIQVKGLGPWSTSIPDLTDKGAEMFLMFTLKRPDVLSTTDLGIQRGMALWTGKIKDTKNNKKQAAKSGKWKYMVEKEMVEEAEKWKPYRSVGSWCMWKVDGLDMEHLDRSDNQG